MPGKNVPFPPMEAELVRELPRDESWQYEPKWDGFSHGGTHGSPVDPLLHRSQAPAQLGLSPGQARLRPRRCLSRSRHSHP
jgi:hypothetical protein